MEFMIDLKRSIEKVLPLKDILPLAPASLWRDKPELAAMLALAASGRFDGAAYLAQYPDVHLAGMDPLQHFVLHGIHEGRSFQVRGSAAGEESTKDNQPPLMTKLFGIEARISPEQLCEKLNKFDVISFDIFDTAIFRKVAEPRDIFSILANEMGWNDFLNARPLAEEDARKMKIRAENHQEITLNEIYELLGKRYSVSPIWQQREIELEMSLTTANPYILSIFNRLLSLGKTVIFASDMYLPKAIIENILLKQGYSGYQRLYLSNELKLRKGDGSMQRQIKSDFRGKSIVHIGDNNWGDIDQTQKAGLEAIYYPQCRIIRKRAYLNNFAGSLHRAIINNTLNNGLYNGSIHFTHGFRCGGILAAGYCQHINKIAEEYGVDTILFCGRDCYNIQQVYDAFFRTRPNVYVETSRIALLSLSMSRYVDDILHRFVFKHWIEKETALTLEQLLVETGFEYLVPELNKYGLSRFTFCKDARKDHFRQFFLGCREIIEEHNQDAVDAAKRYFRAAIGDSKSIIISDVGWSGTCIEALSHFVKREISPETKIYGTLICASNLPVIANRIQAGSLFPYVSGPGINGDIHAFMFPSRMNSQDADKRRLPLEYLFSAPSASLVSYGRSTAQGIEMVRDDNAPDNIEEINEMHRGVFAYNKLFASLKDSIDIPAIPGPAAFSELNAAIRDETYLEAIYGNFYYDACTLPGREGYDKFSSILAHRTQNQLNLESDKKYILFVTLELRVCRHLILAQIAIQRM